jgi:hypothetical protein
MIFATTWIGRCAIPEIQASPADASIFGYERFRQSTKTSPIIPTLTEVRIAKAPIFSVENVCDQGGPGRRQLGTDS